MSKLSQDNFIPCFESARVINDSLVITRKTFDPYKADADQYGNKIV